MSKNRSKSELEDYVSQLEMQLLELKNNKIKEVLADESTDYALGIAIKNGEYHVVNIGFNFEKNTSHIIGSVQAKNSKNFHIVKVKLQDEIWEKILKNLKVIEA